MSEHTSFDESYVSTETGEILGYDDWVEAISCSLFTADELIDSKDYIRYKENENGI